MTTGLPRAIVKYSTKSKRAAGLRALRKMDYHEAAPILAGVLQRSGQGAGPHAMMQQMHQMFGITAENIPLTGEQMTILARILGDMGPGGRKVTRNLKWPGKKGRSVLDHLLYEAIMSHHGPGTSFGP